MSGHSKFANIKHKKEKNDAAKGKIFTIIGKEIAIAVKEALELITTTEWEDVPGTEEKECGNYKDHSLFGAKEWAKEILEKGMSCDPFERKNV